MSGAIPPMADALIRLTPGQKSALAALAAADDRAAMRRQIGAWDRAMDRMNTLALEDRIKAARRVWDGWIFESGAGI